MYKNGETTIIPVSQLKPNDVFHLQGRFILVRSVNFSREPSRFDHRISPEHLERIQRYGHYHINVTAWMRRQNRWKLDDNFIYGIGPRNNPRIKVVDLDLWKRRKVTEVLDKNELFKRQLRRWTDQMWKPPYEALVVHGYNLIQENLGR